jgi:hypothetical protein
LGYFKTCGYYNADSGGLASDKKRGIKLALQAFAPFTPPCMAETGAEHVSMKKSKPA